MNENGLITVTIRGNDDDAQKAKKTIEDLTADIFAQPSQEPEKKEYVMIDWKAAAEQCVMNLVSNFKFITEVTRFFLLIHFHRMRL